MSAARLTLPRHHVARSRLVGAMTGAPVSLVAAGGGYGKTVLATELAVTLGVPTVVVALEAGDTDPDLLFRRLMRAFRRASLSDLAEALASSAADSAEAVERLLDVLHDLDDDVLLIVDEAERAGRESGELLARIAEELPVNHRMVLLARALPAGVARLGSLPGVLELGSTDLAFTADEVVRLLEARGAAADGLDARLFSLCGGWPLATVLALERLTRSQDIEAELERLASGHALIAALIEHQLDELPEVARAAVVQIAHLPELTTEIAECTCGDAAVVEDAAAAGIPFEVAADGSIVLPDLVRDVLVARGELAPDVARRAAATYVERGLVHAAIRVLVAAGADDDAAATLAALPQRQVSRMDVRELRSLLATITPAALDRHPRGWLHLARACEAAAEKMLRTEALERARRQADGDPVLQREVEAELARDLVRDGAVEAAAVAAERLLAAAGAEEVQTRVRALHVLGRTHAWRGGEDGLAAAGPLLREAAELYGQLGLATHRAHALLALAYDVLTLGGRTAEAVDVLGEALAGLPGRARLRGVLLVFQAEALIDLGRLQEAEASLVAAERLGTLLGDARTLGYVAWLRARSAALVGDRERVRLELAEAERHPGEWFAHHSGVEFLAEAAALLDQSGLADEALIRLERARQRRAEAPRYVLLAEGGIEARRGDAARAEQLLAEVAGDSSLEVREQWRVALLRAFAAHRLGEPERCAAFARLAHDLVAQFGSPALMERREPEVTEALRRAGVLPELEPTGAENGAIASVVLLGSFAIRSGAGELQLPAGRPTSLVKLLAARGPRLTVEQALEWLWPEVDVVSGRKRLRNVLNRLREAAGELVVRDGDSLVLQAGEIDFQLFTAAAADALAAADAHASSDRARAALALYSGELLPDDRYEEWVTEPRERLRGRALALLDLLAGHAAREGDVDEALRLLAQAIEADRLDESRYLRAAELYLRQGKRGRALDTLRAAAGALRELDLVPSAAHRELVRSARS